MLMYAIRLNVIFIEHLASSFIVRKTIISCLFIKKKKRSKQLL